MARIVADRGIQMYHVPAGGAVRYHEFDLDCSCTLRVDEQYLFHVGRMDFTSRIQQVADAHICEIEVFMVHTPEARSQRTALRGMQQGVRERAASLVDPPISYVGMDVASQRDETWLSMWSSGRDRASERWQREILEPQRRRSPAEVERSMRENPAPRQAPEGQVQAAARQAQELAQLRGVQLTGVVLDEVSGIGFQAPPKPPEKKPDPVKLDRFQLIELE